MSGDTLFYSTSQWIIYPLIVLLIIAASEAGARLTRLYRGRADIGKELFGTLSVSSFGLLALMLGFTFAMAMTRYEERREAVLREANAIGTAVLRAQVLAEPERWGGSRASNGQLFFLNPPIGSFPLWAAQKRTPTRSRD
jgi:hypothetical protein